MARTLVVAAVCSLWLLAGLAVSPGAADAAIYWSNIDPHRNPQDQAIGRALHDGTQVNTSFVKTGGVLTWGMTADSQHIYWLQGSNIARANSDGSGTNLSFITNVGTRNGGPTSLAVDANHIYWGTGEYVGRANIDGTDADPQWFNYADGYGGSEVGDLPFVRSVAVNATHIYMAIHTSQGNDFVGRVDINGDNVRHELVFVSFGDASAVAVDSTHLYWMAYRGQICQDLGCTVWVNDFGDIGRANLDGTGDNRSFITDVAAPHDMPDGLAVDSTGIYWASNYGVGRANLDGSGKDDRHVDAGTGLFPTGIALTPDPPKATISAPADNQTFTVGQTVRAAWDCSPGAGGGAAITTCGDDANADGTLSTSTAGPHTFTVTAIAADGQRATATIHYTVVAADPPTASIASPADGQTFALGQFVATSFSCTESATGPGISTCLDQAGHTSGAALDTLTAGPHTLTVTATSLNGQTGTATVHYTVAAPPAASIGSPADNRSFNVGQQVATSFSCSEGTGGPGLTTCTDSNGSTSPGTLDTSTVGTHAYTVTATSLDGQTGTATIHYTVVGPPTARIDSPADQQTYNVGQSASASFTCTEAANGPGIATCLDGSGHTSPASLDTSTVGTHTYTVTATSLDGQTGTATIHYTVAAPPTASINSPADNRSFNVGQQVATSFSCSEGGGGPGIASCVDGAGHTSPGSLDTSTVGTHTYTVTATSLDGQTGTATIHYTVVGPPTARIDSPADQQKYNVGQSASASFTCTEAANGPGIASCVDGAGHTSPASLDTSTVGTHTYTVTATSLDGQTGTATIHYTVVGPPTASISSPADAQSFILGQQVATSFICTEADNGPGIATCLDGAGHTSPASLDTSTIGTHAYTVTATSLDGQTGTATISYVVRAPTTLTAARATQSPYRVSATLRSGGAPVAGRTIMFTAGSKTLCTAVTNASGVATCSYPINLALDVLVSYKASFAGDASYLPSTATGKGLADFKTGDGGD